MSLRPGLLLVAVFLCVYGTFALSVDVPKATYGFKSDEATYYMMGHSLVDDWDLTYRREDLVRVWREFSAGPAGVFLKRGSRIGGGPDPALYRMYYGKSFIYPFFAAPLIALFGTNGFLLLNAICLSLVVLCGYLFLNARSRPWPSAILAAAFVMGSVVPVYVVQIMPEVFNFSLACLAYFCWLYKEVAAPERSPRGTQWLFTWKSDVAMAVLLGIATFSKPSSALLFAAPVVWWILSRLKAGAIWSDRGTADDRTGHQMASAFRREIPAIFVFLLVAGGLFGVNMAISGEWNYQGGDRKSYLWEFPFQNDLPTHDVVAAVKSRPPSLLSDIIFNRRTFASNLSHNLEYFFLGRHAGMMAYFFPGFFAMVLMLSAPRRRPLWQWLVLLTALGQGISFLILTPYTWSGGGIGNRYFFGGYGVMLFLLPPVELVGVALLPWLVGGLFVGPMILNPFTASFHPNDNSKAGPVRVFPVELTLLNDLPVFTDPSRGRVEFGAIGEGDPGFLVSFLDDNVHGREQDRSFWTRGDSRADLVFKVNTPIRRVVLAVAAGPVPVAVDVEIEGRTGHVSLQPDESQHIMIDMPGGVMYEKETEGVRVWNVRIVTRGGFTPIFFDGHSSDSRYLGARIKPRLEPK